MEMYQQFHLIKTKTLSQKNSRTDHEDTARVLTRLEQCVKELERTFMNVNSMISHPSRYLPTKHKFNLKTDIFLEPERGYFSVMAWAGGGVIDVVTGLLGMLGDYSDEGDNTQHLPNVNVDNLTSCIYSLLTTWTSSMHGLTFLTATTDQINNLISGMFILDVRFTFFFDLLLKI